MNVKILVDSACDLTEEQYNAYGIEMIPLTVHHDDTEYKDGIDIAPKTIYDAMREGKSPTTSQVPLQTFKTIFTAYAEKKQPLLYLAFSSELSGTYQTAKMMEQQVRDEHPDADIHVLDTKCASIGYGLVAIRVAQLANEGASMEELIKMASYHATHMEHIFTVDDLTYLYRGGRVSRTAAFVGTLLKIKPILHVDSGKLIPIEKIRGSKRLLDRILELMDERGVDFENQVIGISHGDDLERAKQLAARIKEKYPVKDVIIEMVGAVIGAHSGPGTLALFFLNSSYK
ncbi:MAG TPA: DegV family protein [Cerasibacillus sp.]|uniref:DegV family protein n=1 Tax=Cerasibacillus sp. TaxID=2498711 RepID=UPI002F418084